MLELRLTDLELQRLLAPALKKRLRREGFEFSTSEAKPDGHPMLLFPINLDLAESISIRRDDDGVWVFQQEKPDIRDRMIESLFACSDAVALRELPLWKRGDDE